MQQFKRAFRLWEFKVSHDQLLLRSPRGKTEAKNLDLAFVGVEYLELPTMLRDLRLGEGLPDDQARADQILGRHVGREQIFIVESTGRRYMIVAAAMKVLENDLDIFESSLERF